MGLFLFESELRGPGECIAWVSSPAVKGRPLAVISIFLRYDSVLLLLLDGGAVVVGAGKRRFVERSSEDDIVPDGKKDGTPVAMEKLVGSLSIAKEVRKTYYIILYLVNVPSQSFLLLAQSSMLCHPWYRSTQPWFRARKNACCTAYRTRQRSHSRAVTLFALSRVGHSCSNLTNNAIRI